MFADDEKNEMESQPSEESKEPETPQGGIADTVAMEPESKKRSRSRKAEETILEEPEPIQEEPKKAKSAEESKPKAEEGWVTAKVPSIQASQGAQPQTPQAEPIRPVEAAPKAASMPSPSVPAASEGIPAAGSGGVKGLFEKAGIKDENTQRWVLIGGGVLVFLCCACACVAIAPVLIGALGS